MLTKNKEYWQKSVELNTFRAVDGRQPQWLEFREQNPTPFLKKKKSGFLSFIPVFLFLKDLEIGTLEARTGNILVCGYESVWRWERERQRNTCQQCRSDSKWRSCWNDLKIYPQNKHNSQTWDSKRRKWDPQHSYLAGSCERPGSGVGGKSLGI